MTQNSSDKTILFALWLLIFSASSQIIIIAPILPVIGEQLSMPEQLQGLLITAYALMVGLFAIIIGPISDKIGRRRVLIIGTFSMAIALTLHGLVMTYQQLILMRAIAGIAGGILSGSVVSYVADYFPVTRRGWANGWVMSGAASGQIIGIPLGTIMAEYFGFRIPFLMFGITMFATFYMIYTRVPQPSIKRNTKALTIYGALKNYYQIIRIPRQFASILAFFMMFVSIGIFVVYFPTWLQQEFGVTGTFIASIFLVGGVANVITGPQAGKLSDRIGRKSLVIISCIGTSIIFLSTTFMIFDSWIAYPYFFLIMMLVAIRVSPFQTLLSESISDDRRGSLMSLTAALGQAGLGIGGAFAGLMYADFGFVSNSIIASVAIFCTGILIWRYVPESEHFRKKAIDVI
jgi:predicted MFS family arabinose efflux permease